MKITAVIPALGAYFATTPVPDNVRKAVLFGSYARGEAQLSSDVDVALIAREPWDFESRNTVREWLEAFDANLVISPFFTTEDKLAHTQDKFDANYWVNREGITLWER